MFEVRARGHTVVLLVRMRNSIVYSKQSTKTEPIVQQHEQQWPLLGPIFSLVFAFMLTQSFSTSRASAMISRIAGMCGRSLGCSAITTESALLMRHDLPVTIFITCFSKSTLFASFTLESSGGKWCPMSPRQRAPKLHR